MSEELLSYLDYCKNHAIEELENYIDWGESSCGCDLAHKLTETINVDGSATFSTYLAKQYIKEWWDEAGEYYEYQKVEYGEIIHNPFESPEAFHVCMVIHGVERILTQCPTIETFWDKEKLLTKSLIKQIIKEIKEVSEIYF